MLNALIVGLILLGTLSILDIFTYRSKKGLIPSFLTTAFIMLAFMVTSNVYALIWGGLMALVFRDMGLFEGAADFKAVIIGAVLLPNVFAVLFFGLFITVIGTIAKYVFKKYKAREMPFIPVISYAFGVMAVIIGI